jgi:hypothetical protein
MFIYCTKQSSVVNLDLFWKQVFSYNLPEYTPRGDSTVEEHSTADPESKGTILARCYSTSGQKLK